MYKEHNVYNAYFKVGKAELAPDEDGQRFPPRPEKRKPEEEEPWSGNHGQAKWP